MKCIFQCQYDLQPLLQIHWILDQFVSVILGGCHSDDQNLILTWNWIDANGPFQFFPPLVSQYIVCFFLSNRKWPHNSTRKFHKCWVLFSKNTRHNNILEKRTIVNFEQPVARIRFVLLNYFSEHLPLVIETSTWWGLWTKQCLKFWEAQEQFISELA